MSGTNDEPKPYSEEEVDDTLEDTFPASDPVPAGGGITGPEDTKQE